MAEGDELTPIDQILGMVNSEESHLLDFEKADRDRALHALGRAYSSAILENNATEAEPDYSTAMAIMDEYTPEDSALPRLFSQQEMFFVNGLAETIDKVLHPPKSE